MSVFFLVLSISLVGKHTDLSLDSVKTLSLSEKLKYLFTSKMSFLKIFSVSRYKTYRISNFFYCSLVLTVCLKSGWSKDFVETVHIKEILKFLQ